MGSFSKTQEIDNPICPCQQGNIFLNHLPLEAPAISFSVNGKDTGALPTDLIYKLDNSLEGTTSRLSFKHLDTGREITLIEDLDQFTQSRPEDVGVIIDQVKLPEGRKPYVPQGRLMEYAYQTTARTEAEDVLVLQIDDGSVPEGEHDVDSIDPDLAYRISNALLNGLELSDRLSGADDLLAWSRENLKIGDAPILIDFTLTGTDGPPAIAEIIATISYNRQFLIDALHRQSRKVKVWKSGAGKLLMSFRYAQPARGLFQGLALGVTANRVAQISAGATQSLRPLAANVAKKLPLIGVFIVGAIEVIEFFGTPPAERELNDLLAGLFVELGAVIIGGIVGGIGAAILVSFLAISAPLAIIGIGVAAGIVVGVALTSAADYLGIEEAVKNALDNFGSGIESMAQRLEGLIESIDEAIYGPLDWARDLDAGIRQRIDGMVQSQINNLIRNPR